MSLSRKDINRIKSQIGFVYEQAGLISIYNILDEFDSSGDNYLSISVYLPNSINYYINVDNDDLLYTTNAEYTLQNNLNKFHTILTNQN